MTDLPHPDRLLLAVTDAATAWADPDEPARAAAVEATLSAPNAFTEEAVAFAVNQQMHALTPGALRAWIAGRHARHPRTVGVVSAGNVPFADLQDFLAVLLTGHRFLGAVSSKSPALLPAFAGSVRERLPELPAGFAPAGALFRQADAVIATGTDEAGEWAAAQASARGIPPERLLLRGNRYAAAVLDGSEGPAERGGLAEDVLLHEGHGCRNVAIVWAPRGRAPDPYLDAFMQFREVFPAHPDTNGALRMPRAFLEATGQSHAYGEGFLVSRGEPEVQRPGHLRWVEYDRLDEAVAWLAAHADELQLVSASPRLHPRLAALAGSPPLVALGEAQRPPPDWRPDGRDTVDFLAGL